MSSLPTPTNKPSLRWRWALVAGLWADFVGSAVIAFLFSGANGVTEPVDRALLTAYGGATGAVLLLPFNIALAGIASRMVSRRLDRPPDEILTTTLSLHLALLATGYGISSRASQWWFYERSDGILSSANLTGIAGWLAAATVVFFAMQALWHLRERWRLRIRTLSGAVTAVCLLMPFAYAPSHPPPSTPPPPAPSAPPSISGARVIWIGIDGGDWEILQPMMDRGEMPTLTDLCRRGVRGRLESVFPYASQPSWITAATGARPERHGVRSRLVVRFPGVQPFNVRYQTKEFLPVFGAGLLLLESGLVELIPTPRYFWNAEPLWLACSRAGGKSAIIGWPSTWPADPINGLIITDRFYYSVWEALYQRHRGVLPGNVHPPEWSDRARALRVDPRTFTDAQGGLFFDAAPDLLARFRAAKLDPLSRDAVAYLGRGVGMDMTDIAIAEEVLRKDPPDLMAVYTTGFDLAGHGFWIEQAPELFPGASPAGRPELRATFLRYCRFLDAQIARLVRQAGADTVVLLSSDHGLVPAPHHPVWPVAHDPNGMFVLAGPQIRSGAEVDGARIEDLAPTIAYLLGIPAPRQNQGRILQECFTPRFLAEHPPSLGGPR